MRPEPDKTRKGMRFSVALAIKLMLVTQLAIAAFLVIGDLANAGIKLSLPTRVPTLERPVAPGDQTRRYQPDQTRTNPYTGPDVGPMPARLQFNRNGSILEISGQIASGDSARFAKLMDGFANKPDGIELNSPGGSVTDALEIGRRIRTEQLDTSVEAGQVCLSACPYILFSGVRRSVEDTGYVGMHQHYFGENTVLPAFLAVEDIQRGQGEVMAYLVEMEIDPLIMLPALVTPPDEIYILTQDELIQYGVLTEPGE